MIFTIITDGKEEIKFVTQQYSVGTYLIINDNPQQQMAIEVEEQELHKKVRETAIREGDKIVNGTILDIQSYLPINEFHK